jgi:hypothetical protein
MRPVPNGGRLISLEQALAGGGSYDAIIVHNVRDLLDIRDLKAPKILVLHVSLTARRLEEPGAPSRQIISDQVRTYLRLVGGIAVAVSEMKRGSWGLDCAVVRPTADPNEYGPHAGQERRLLRVANHVSRRRERFGWNDFQSIVAGLPWQLIGDNPDMPESRPSRDWNDLKNCYRTHRAYAHTAGPGLDDGYNLAVLEAMCSGLPVLSNLASDSPVTDGENGFISGNLGVLAEAASRLLDDPALARRLGDRARETVVRDFPVEGFVRSWHHVIERARKAYQAPRAA